MAFPHNQRLILRDGACIPEEPVGTNMDIEVLYQMFKDGVSYEELVKKGNTVPEGKKPISGIEAAMNMRKKFK